MEGAQEREGGREKGLWLIPHLTCSIARCGEEGRRGSLKKRGGKEKGETLLSIKKPVRTVNQKPALHKKKGARQRGNAGTPNFGYL